MFCSLTINPDCSKLIVFIVRVIALLLLLICSFLQAYFFVCSASAAAAVETKSYSERQSCGASGTTGFIR